MTTIRVHLKGTSPRKIKEFRCPKSEKEILKVLLGKKMKGIEICRKSKRKIRLLGIYTLLARLIKRGLIIKKITVIKVLDSQSKQSIYSTTFDRIEQ